MKCQVTIGPEFFAKAKSDYANWRWAIVREFMQNSVDCHSTRIDLNVTEAAGKTTLVVRNDGVPMTEEILVGKFFALGGSGKGFSGTNVGGFGKAKEILCYAHDSYQIRTGSLLAVGSGASYDLTVDAPDFAGTETTVVLDGKWAAELVRHAERFVSLALVKPQIYVNGKLTDGKLNRGTRRTELSFGEIYTNKSHSNLLVARIGGIPMFTRYCEYKGCVVLELNGSSEEVLNSNRDSLKWDSATELDAFVTELAVDKRKALKAKPTGPIYERFAGKKLGFEKTPDSSSRTFDMRELLQEAVATVGTPVREVQLSGSIACETVGTMSIPMAGLTEAAVSALLSCGAEATDDYSSGTPTWSLNLSTEAVAAAVSAGIVLAADPEPEPEPVYGDLESEFILKNETGRTVPAQYRPESGKFSGYSKKLVRAWAKLILELHRIFEHDAKFSVGFIFDGDAGTEAEFESTEEYGNVYYLGPAVLKDGKFTARFHADDKGQLISAAVHEFCHGELGCGHNDRYSCRITDMFAKILNGDNLAKLRACLTSVTDPRRAEACKRAWVTIRRNRELAAIQP